MRRLMVNQSMLRERNPIQHAGKARKEYSFKGTKALKSNPEMIDELLGQKFLEPQKTRDKYSTPFELVRAN